MMEEFDLMLSCIEPGCWPEGISADLSNSELEALVEHAELCSYHRLLLDEDDKKFLANYSTSKHLTNVLVMGESGFTHVLNEFHTASHEAVNDTTDQELEDERYLAYQRWRKERCPIEILQIRGGGISVSVFEVKEGGVWHVRFDRGTSIVQLWTLCRQHHDEVLLAVYPLASLVGRAGKTSTVSFPNNQSIYLNASVDEQGHYDLFVGCTGACTPTSVSGLLKLNSFTSTYESSSTWQTFVPNLASCCLDSLADRKELSLCQKKPSWTFLGYGQGQVPAYGTIPIYAWNDIEKKNDWRPAPKRGFIVVSPDRDRHPLRDFNEERRLSALRILGSTSYLMSAAQKVFVRMYDLHDSPSYLLRHRPAEGFIQWNPLTTGILQFKDGMIWSSLDYEAECLTPHLSQRFPTHDIANYVTDPLTEFFSCRNESRLRFGDSTLEDLWNASYMGLYSQLMGALYDVVQDLLDEIVRKDVIHPSSNEWRSSIAAVFAGLHLHAKLTSFSKRRFSLIKLDCSVNQLTDEPEINRQDMDYGFHFPPGWVTKTTET